MKPIFLFVTVMVLTGAGRCLAGLQMESTNESLSDGKTSNQTIRVDSERMMLDIEGERGRQTIVFLGGERLFRMIEHGEKTYREMTQQDLEQMGSQLGDAMAKMQEQLKNMPPAQRQMMEKMMKGKMPPMMGQAGAKTVYTAAGTGRAGQWDCARYDGAREGEKVAEVCTVDFQQLGLQPSDFAVMQKMADFFSKMMPPGMRDGFSVGSETWQQEQGFPGVPVSRTILRNGKAVQRTTMKSVTRMDFDAAIFDVPAGYKKESMPRMGGR